MISNDEKIGQRGGFDSNDWNWTSGRCSTDDSFENLNVPNRLLDAGAESKCRQ